MRVLSPSWPAVKHAAEQAGVQACEGARDGFIRSQAHRMMEGMEGTSGCKGQGDAGWEFGSAGAMPAATRGVRALASIHTRCTARRGHGQELKDMPHEPAWFTGMPEHAVP